jgi:acetyltransferase-like isoleucine patch superfamily enzyme
MSSDNLIEKTAAISSDSEVGPGSWVRAGASIFSSTIGRSCFLGFRAQTRFVSIGNGSMIGSKTKLLGEQSERIVIGANAWIGTNATVAPSIRIGDGAVVAAGALVTKDVAEDEIVVGRPARVVSRRIVSEDGFPDPAPVIARVRQRARDRLPSFLDVESLSPDRAIDDNRLEGWSIARNTLIDAELRGGRNVAIGDHCVLIGRSLATGGMSPQGGVSLAEGVTVGDFVVIEGVGGLVVGERTVIGDHVTIVTSTHDHRLRSLPWAAAPVSIGRGCVIGARAVIVGPVDIGDFATIDPCSVVIRDVETRSRSRGVISLMEKAS